MPDDPVRRVRSSLQRAFSAGWIDPNNIAVVAVSGGPDSTCLLHALATSPEAPLLQVAHLDHGLRGREGNEDAVAVLSLAASLGLSATTGFVDVAAMVRRGQGSLEISAREVRYRFLGEIARTVGANRIILGHTADDQAETILLRLVRGSGPSGLAGMAPFSTVFGLTGPGPSIVRPFLEIERSTVEAYCESYRLAPRVDASNAQPITPRNRIRSVVMPALRSENPAVVRALARAGELFREQATLVRDLTLDRWKELVEDARGVRFRRRALTNLPAALRSEAVRIAVAELSASRAELSASHVASALDLLSGPTGKWIPLPGEVRAVVSRDFLTFQRAVGEQPTPSTVQLDVPGEVRFAGWRIVAEQAPVAQPKEDTSGTSVWLGEKGPFVVRGRQRGDRYRPLGAAGRRKVKDLLRDLGIAADERDEIPILVGRQGIVWVVGGRVADDARVPHDSHLATRVTAFRTE